MLVERVRTHASSDNEHLKLGRQTWYQRQDRSVPAIEMKDLVRKFGEHTAIDHLTLTVMQGEIFGLLGPNGSGKTTTINMISGLSRPTSGVVRVLGLGYEQQAIQVKQLLGCVPQETALYEELSAVHNMEYHAALYRVPRQARRERIDAMLHLVSLYEKRNQLVKTFSGGMKRRLALARALLHEPKVLYLDEPSLGVDVQNRHALYEFIRTLPQKGVTVLLTTNDMHEAEVLCTRVAIIDHGRLQLVDTPQNLARRSKIEIVLDAPWGASDVAEIIRELDGIQAIEQLAECITITSDRATEKLDTIKDIIQGQGRAVRSINLVETDLETEFLRVTGSLLRD